MDLYFYVAKILTPLILPSNLIFFLLVIFFYLSIIKKKKYFLKFFFIFFLIFFSIGVFPIGKNLIFHFLEKNFFNSKIEKNFDYIFVPSGNDDRLLKAIEIKNKYLYESKIIYSAGNNYLNSSRINDLEFKFAIDLINNLKLNSKDFIFLPNARNTIENFKELNKYLSTTTNKKKILLVTSAFHIKRCLTLAKKYNLNVSVVASSFLSDRENFSLIHFYQFYSLQKNLFYFDIFFKELMSIIVIKYLI